MKIRIENWNLGTKALVVLEHELQPLEYLSIFINDVEYMIQEQDGDLKIHIDGQIQVIPHASNSITLSAK